MKTRKLSIYLSNWCKKNGFECGCHYGNEFAYFFAKNFVQYSFLFDKEQDRLFRTVFDELGLKYNCDIFILSFFHELGHLETDDEWTEKQSFAFAEKKRKLDGSIEEDNLTYFHIPDELRATEWATNFINEHPQEIENLWKEIQKRIFVIYHEEGLDF